MVNRKRIKELARSDVAKFSKEFYNKYGVYPVVMYSVNEDTKIAKLPLHQVEKVVEKLIKQDVGKKYSLWSKERLRFVIEYRQVMFKILLEMGHTSLAIGLYFKYSHCTVLYSAKIATGYININDERIINIYNKIIYEINKESGTFDVIQWDN